MSGCMAEPDTEKNKFRQSFSHFQEWVYLTGLIKLHANAQNAWFVLADDIMLSSETLLLSYLSV